MQQKCSERFNISFMVKNTFINFDLEEDAHATGFQRSYSWPVCGKQPLPSKLGVLDEKQEGDCVIHEPAGDDATTVQVPTPVASEIAKTPGLPKINESHVKGECNPCVFFASSFGCAAGAACSFCHLRHMKLVTFKRPRKQTRDKCKGQVACLFLNDKEDLVAKHHQLQSLAKSSHYMRTLIHGYLEGNPDADDEDVGSRPGVLRPGRVARDP
mmetsp:Transcript_30620/g.70655  ORF Transcript_30620/g.70655 Transcript_30620/m.70655 type:complete len:213 (+) Transcript_30620:109-747(+)